MSTLYDILNINQNADIKQVKQAYYKLVHTCHPDVSLAQNAHEIMAQINKAYETLIDPIRRAEYDAIIGGQRLDGSEHHKTTYFVGGKLEIIQKKQLAYHHTPIYSCSFLNGTSRFITSSFNNEIYGWQIDQVDPLFHIKIEGGAINTIQAVEENKIVAVGSSETSLNTWLIEKNEVLSYRSNLSEWICTTKPSPCGRWIATGCMSGRLVWTNINNINKPKDHVKHKHALMSLAWSFDSKLLATGSCEAIVYIWDTCSFQVLGSLTYLRSDVTAIAYSRCNQYIAVACVDLSISIFRKGQERPVKVFFGHEKPVETICFHPKGLFVASASRDGIVYLWNMSEINSHIKWRASYQSLNSIDFSTSGQFLLTVGMDRIIRIWELKIHAGQWN